MTPQTILRAILVLVAVSHVVLGVLACLAGEGTVTSLIADIYGVKLTLNPQLQHVIRIVGAFMIAIGIMAAFAIRDPIRNRAIVDGIGILQLIRAAQRVLFVAQIQEAFAMPPSRLYVQSAFFAALGVVLLLLRPKARA